ncbi:MAG: hypothetical protein AAF492_33560 [Verrucomicrobiota bacterium]
MKTRLFLIGFLGLLYASPSIYATTQFPDVLLVDGKVHGIYDFPLDEIISEEKRRELFSGLNTACYRGYVAHWEVKDNTLLLTAVEKPGWPGKPKKVIPLNRLFDTSAEPVEAIWFSGLLRSPRFNVWISHASLSGGFYLGHQEFRFEQGRLISSSFRLSLKGLAKDYFICYHITKECKVTGFSLHFRRWYKDSAVIKF